MSKSPRWVVQEDRARKQTAVGKPEPPAKRKNRDTKPKPRRRKKRT